MSTAFDFKMAAMGIVKNVTKVVIGGGAIYATAKQGVWSTDTTEGSHVLHTVRSSVAPTASEYIAKIPSTSDVNNSVLSFWNKGVTATFSTIAEAPEFGKKAVDSTKRMLTSK
ncbi:MICOS complex subunit MIC13-like [Babylonia areolata]|uniref:MICOS complex subunit MIC13-like n=1 Tax=Babylonia areolata TaxID=304850 RepID=UPI003FD08B8F